MKRREFLNGSVAAGAAALIVPAAALGGETPIAKSVVGTGPAAETAGRFAFSRAWFERNLQSTFRIDAGGGRTVDAELIEIRNSGSSPRVEQFTAVFRMPAGSSVGGLRAVQHREGRFVLHLDAPHDFGATQVCQAHFSLLSDAQARGAHV